MRTIWTPFQRTIPTHQTYLPFDRVRANAFALWAEGAAGLSPEWNYTNSFTRLGAGTPGGITSVFTDDFNRANENPLDGGHWVTQPGWNAPIQLSSNQAAGTDGSNNASYADITLNDDQYAQLKLNDVDTGINGGGPCVRMSAIDNSMYGTQVYSTTVLGIFRFLNGSYTELDNATITHTPGDVYRITVVGSNLEAFQNGVSKVTASDNNLTTGRAGIFAYNNNDPFDDFECGNMSGAAVDGGGTLTKPYSGYWFRGTGKDKQWVRADYTYDGTDVTKIAVYFSDDNEATYVPMLDADGNYVLDKVYDTGTLVSATWGKTP